MLYYVVVNQHIELLITNIEHLIQYFPPDNFYRISMENYLEELHPNMTPAVFAKAFLDANVTHRTQVWIPAGTFLESIKLVGMRPWPSTDQLIDRNLGFCCLGCDPHGPFTIPKQRPHYYFLGGYPARFKDPIPYTPRTATSDKLGYDIPENDFSAIANLMLDSSQLVENITAYFLQHHNIPSWYNLDNYWDLLLANLGSLLKEVGTSPQLNCNCLPWLSISDANDKVEFHESIIRTAFLMVERILTDFHGMKKISLLRLDAWKQRATLDWMRDADIQFLNWKATHPKQYHPYAPSYPGWPGSLPWVREQYFIFHQSRESPHLPNLFFTLYSPIAILYQHLNDSLGYMGALHLLSSIIKRLDPFENSNFYAFREVTKLSKIIIASRRETDIYRTIEWNHKHRQEEIPEPKYGDPYLAGERGGRSKTEEEQYEKLMRKYWEKRATEQEDFLSECVEFDNTLKAENISFDPKFLIL